MFPRIFIIAHFFDLSRLLHKKADDGNQNRNVRQKKSEAASGTTAHSLPPNGGEGSDSISVTKEADDGKLCFFANKQYIVYKR